MIILVDINPFPLVISITVFILLLVVYIISEKLASIQRKAKHTKEMLELKYSYEQTLLRSQLEIQEETLKNISQEIHDNIGQVLSLAKLHLGTLPVPPMDENAEAIIQSKALIGKAITDLRSLSKSLHPDRVNELSLEDNIRHELEILEKTRLYETKFKVLGSPFAIPVQTRIILFRMVQEAISNIIKHAFANQVSITLDYEPALFSLTIKDNGVGISNEKLAPTVSGIGIKNMQNRSKIIGASFSLNVLPEGGTEVKIALPSQAQ